MRITYVKIIFQTGKKVPVLIPSFVEKVMEFFTDKKVREKAGVQENNPYTFANDSKFEFLDKA